MTGLICFSRCRASLAVALLVTTQLVAAQNADSSAMLLANLLTIFPAGTIRTADMADQALADVSMVRTQIESQFTVEEDACYPTFFASSCLDDAKERRRAALARIRPVEIE